MIPKPFDAILQADVDTLLADEVPEGRTLDYKASFPGNSDEDKKEFLYDVSSFANAGGGDIVFGVAEQKDENGKSTGLPSADLPGLKGVSVDAELLRLEGLLQTGVAPRIPGVRMRAVAGYPGGPVVLLRIPRSFATPHMVTLKGQSRFYTRNSAGKHQMDIGEIRAAFSLSESGAERVRRFREERLGRIFAGESPLGRIDGPTAVLHLFPYSALDTTRVLDLVKAKSDNTLLRLAPLRVGVGRPRNNFDGLIVATESTASFPGYTQLYRNGVIEMVSRRVVSEQGTTKCFHGIMLGRDLVEKLQDYVEILAFLEAGLPVIAMFSLLGAKGLFIPAGSYRDMQTPIDREVLPFADLLIEQYGFDPPAVLKPVLDAMWQSAGWNRCFDYDDSGAWKPQ